MTPTEICQAISRAYDAEYAPKPPTPRTGLWASSIGECPRELYHQVVDWEQRPPFDPWLLQLFDHGEETERIDRAKIERLRIDGIGDGSVRLTESQLSFVLKDRDGVKLCSGKIDGRLRIGNRVTLVYEHKDVGDLKFGRLNTFDDLRHDPLHRRYRTQMLLYMYALAEPIGVYLLHCRGHWKLLPVELEHHLAECEDALKRMRVAVDAIAAGEPPAYHDDASTCLHCWARKAGVCSPPMRFAGDVVLLDDDALVDLLDTMRRTKPQADEHAEADERFKAHFRELATGTYLIGAAPGDVQTFIVGDYEVACQMRHRKGFTPKPVEPTTFPVTTWRYNGRDND